MTTADSETLLRQLLDAEGIEPNDFELYRLSMTHSSYLNEQGLPAWEGNERLEFLGDAVLGLVVTQSLYEKFPESKEGDLSKIKSVVVSRAILGSCADRMGLGKPLKLGVGESKTGGKKRNSILAAVFESFLGAVYLDQGLAAADLFCQRHLDPLIAELATGDKAQDDKSRFQERVQQVAGMIPRYWVTKSEGPDHDKWFVVEVSLRGKILGTGEGPSKKSAEQDAAQKALSLLDTQGEDVLAGEGSETDED